VEQKLYPLYPLYPLLGKVEQNIISTFRKSGAKTIIFLLYFF
jgi:hypothetical protein